MSTGSPGPSAGAGARRAAHVALVAVAAAVVLGAIAALGVASAWGGPAGPCDGSVDLRVAVAGCRA
jgi:hypothetical protein